MRCNELHVYHLPQEHLWRHKIWCQTRQFIMCLDKKTLKSYVLLFFYFRAVLIPCRVTQGFEAFRIEEQLWRISKSVNTHTHTYTPTELPLTLLKFLCLALSKLFQFVTFRGAMISSIHFHLPGKTNPFFYQESISYCACAFMNLKLPLCYHRKYAFVWTLH